ncbi:hypothetical protein [Chitinophaga qingshengii]|uniref:Lipoprotein n=1 Tax=Chitinophaga qingshengii TaxID=1569794 RepID=A0ABR7TTV3_9BACT|nr:hypothetical protein [Chitinophaga qingshengii]MBC9933857.1 hypothetical protein [Chitinophaga qingshengii]
MPLRLLLFIYILAAGCRYQPVNILTNDKRILIDSSLPVDKAKFYNNDDYTTAFPVYYIGPATDRIVLPSRPLPHFRQTGDRDFYRDSTWTHTDSAHLQIMVDAAFRISNTARYYHYEQIDDQPQMVLDSIVSYKAIPVFLYNRGSGIFSIGIFGALTGITLQVRNEKGKWQDIALPAKYYCSTGASMQVLQSGEMAVAKLFLLQGDYPTEARLKFRQFRDSIYSNVFPFTISKQQLKRPVL